MTLLEEIKKIDTSPKKLKEFGRLVGGIFAVLGAFVVWRGHHPETGKVFLAVSVLLLVPGFAFPSVLKIPYRLWMGLALVIGAVMSRVILTLVFFLVLTPLSLLAKLRKEHLLDLVYSKDKETYWEKKENAENPQSYERQY
ncbi:MAG TPA: SxtJ family membrane protein [Verrucomicrobiae bacterium]|jgi:hypothetical protein|nr:SxtJ family membrane protein [Verrucomicrobiae bacterium]